MPFVEPTEDDRAFMRLALEQAQRGYDEGGVPVGSVLTEKGRLVAKGTIGGSRMATRSRMARWILFAAPDDGLTTATRSSTRRLAPA